MTFVATLLLSFLVIAAMVAAMSIGVMAGRKPIKGSCGGVGSGGCELCRGHCRNESDDAAPD